MALTVLNPGTLIVLEGLDKTGKTTQSIALRQVLDAEATLHVHMPSGLSSFTEETYSMLESTDRSPTSGLAKQLAHLACHAESVPLIVESLQRSAVVLDRWWWSTVAYGWHSGDLPRAGVSEAGFRNLVGAIWGRLQPHVVFLFDLPYAADANNSDPIRQGYQQLAAEYPDVTVRVPRGDPGDVTRHIVSQLGDRGLIRTPEAR